MLVFSTIGFVFWGILSDKTKRPDLLTKLSFLIECPLGYFMLTKFINWTKSETSRLFYHTFSICLF